MNKQTNRLFSFQDFQAFQVSIMKQQDSSQCISLLSESFKDVQPYKSLNMSVKELSEIFKQIVRVGIMRQLSIVIREKFTKKLACCCVTLDSLDDDNLNVNARNQDNYQAIVHLLLEITQQYESQHPVQKQGHSAYIWDLTVSPQFRGNNLTRLVLEETLKVLKNKKYQFAFVQMISPLTQRTFIKTTKYFKEIKRVKIKDIEYKGKKPWQNVQTEAIFAECNLNILK